MRIRSFLGACCLILLAISFASGLTLTTDSHKHKNPKLSTPLLVLSTYVTQETSRPVTTEAIKPPAGFSKETLPKSLQDTIRAGHMHITDNGEVQVYIEMNAIDAASLDELRSYGVTIQIVGKPKPDKSKGEVLTTVPTVQGLLPVTMISQVSSLPLVRYIRLPDYGIKGSGSVDSQGDQILRAMQARTQFGVDGTGVKVGVISDGIGGIFATGCTTCAATTATPSPITLGDLPAATGTRNASGVLTSVSGGITAQSFPSSAPNLEPPATDTASGVGAEGTAMLEIVHDLAPGAQLYFANAADGTSLSFQQAVDYLASNTDIVVDDISFLSQLPYDGTSPVSTNTATNLNTDANSIRGYFTAVGNLAFNHWGEPWTASSTNMTLACPAGPVTAQTGDEQLFQATANTFQSVGQFPRAANLVFIPNGATLAVILSWNDPFAGSSNDYDLFLYTIGFNMQNITLVSPLACSTNPQTGTQPPVEALAYTNNTGATQEVAIFIQNFNALPRNFDLFIQGVGNGNALGFFTPSGSVPAQADAGGSPVSVVSVGAIDQTQCSVAGVCTGTIEPYSSQGPTEATPQADARMKPDITATDDVVVTGAAGFGLNGPLATATGPCGPTQTPCYFAGTSAAAPHTAAIAALALQAAPCLLSSSSINMPATARANLRNFLTSTAVPLPGIAQTVPNNIEGFGLVDALAAVTAAMPKPNAGLAQTITGTSTSGMPVTLDGSASTDPDSCPLVSFNWTGACGSASGMKPMVTCPLGNDTETLTVSNGGATTGLPTSTVQITVSDFTNSASPASATISRGQTASYTVTIGSQFGAFTNPVSLTCSGVPSLSSCTLSQTSVTPGATSATSMLTITTTAPSVLPPLFEPRIPNGPFLWLGVILALAAIVALARSSGRKRIFAAASCTLLVCVVVPILSCGGGGGPKNPGTPAGTYTITVSGTSNQLQHSATVNLTVQ